jgi:hypothetical protein
VLLGKGETEVFEKPSPSMPQKTVFSGPLAWVAKSFEKQYVCEILNNTSMSEFLDGVAIVFSGAALLFSGFTFIKNDRDQKRLHTLQSLQANGTLLMEAWRQLAASPRLLRFHSVSEEELKKRDLTHEDLAYLLILFETADYYYQHNENDSGPFLEGSLRYEILKSPATRSSWPLLKPFFIASEKYSQRIEATINSFGPLNL